MWQILSHEFLCLLKGTIVFYFAVLIFVFMVLLHFFVLFCLQRDQSYKIILAPLRMSNYTFDKFSQDLCARYLHCNKYWKLYKHDQKHGFRARIGSRVVCLHKNRALPKSFRAPYFPPSSVPVYVFGMLFITPYSKMTILKLASS